MLKTGKEKPVPRNNDKHRVNKSLLWKVWIKKQHMEYATEVSVLNYCKDRLPRNVCPHCEHLYYAQDLHEETIEQYVYRCYHCGALLNIKK